MKFSLRRSRDHSLLPFSCFPYFRHVWNIFLRRSLFSDNAKEASRKMLSWLTAAGREGARELDDHVSLRLFGTCMSCTHRRHLTGGRSSAHRSAPQQPLVRWRRCVHDMHVPNSLVDTHSSSPRAPHECVSTCTCSGCRCRPRESIFCEASSASSLSDERRRKPKAKLKNWNV